MYFQQDRHGQIARLDPLAVAQIGTLPGIEHLGLDTQQPEGIAVLGERAHVIARTHIGPDMGQFGDVPTSLHTARPLGECPRSGRHAGSQQNQLFHNQHIT